MKILGIGKNMKRKVGVLLLASAFIAVGISISGTSPTARADDEGSGLSAPIKGTWILNINRVTQGFNFSALMSFTAGGVALATGTTDRTPPPAISPIYGSWKRVGQNSFVATVAFFVFDPAGNALAMIKTNETFQVVDKNKLTGTGTALSCDVNGDNCVDANLPITITGKRLIAQGASS